MKWSDFLKYSKYVAVFYAAAFVIGILGIWMQPHGQWMWTAVMFFGAALAGNIALGSYQYNHKSEMKFAKATYVAKQEGGVVDLTSNSKDLAIATDDEGRPVLSPQLSELVEGVAYQAARKARGY